MARAGRKPISLKVTDEERTLLKIVANAHTSQQRMAVRARIILLSDAGRSLQEVSEKVGLTKASCLKWRKRFRQKRLEGLKDEPRSGKPRTISPEERIRVIALACSKTDDGSNAWSIRKLAKKTGRGLATIHRILNEGEIKPHKVKYWCGKSPDPEFEEKQARIIGLYMNPPENALVISVDEKSQIQALDRTQPELPLKAGYVRRQTCTYSRHGTTCLLAALAVHDGEITARCIDRNNSDNFLKFLKHLYRKYTHKHIHVILDNLSVHKNKKVKEWVAKRRYLTLHFTPTYASWLNQIEIWFNIFSRDVLRGGIWKSKRQLVGQIMLYIKRYNEEQAHPFPWTYTGKPLTR